MTTKSKVFAGTEFDRSGELQAEKNIWQFAIDLWGYNHTSLDREDNPIYSVRKDPLENGAILYDRHGKAAAIKNNGKLLEILEGEE